MPFPAKTLLLLATICTLAACGFRPLYGTHSATQNTAVTATLSQIAIATIPDRSGQYLRNALIDRFYKTGRPADPLYTLRLTPLRETITDLDITKSSTATRAQLRLDTVMTLTDREDNIIMTRNLTAITSYNILQSRFTTRVSEQATRDSALDDLATQIERHLALHFAR